MWGGGGLPTSLDSNLTQVYSDDAFVKGMARLGGVPLQPFPDHFSVAFAQSSLVGRHVVVSDSLFSTVLHGDVQCWETQLLRWEQDWFGPALHALQQNQFDELELYFGSQRRYRVRRNHLRRFWRKNRPMSSFLYSSTSERDA